MNKRVPQKWQNTKSQASLSTETQFNNIYEPNNFTRSPESSLKNCHNSDEYKTENSYVKMGKSDRTFPASAPPQDGTSLYLGWRERSMPPKAQSVVQYPRSSFCLISPGDLMELTQYRCLHSVKNKEKRASSFNGWHRSVRLREDIEPGASFPRGSVWSTPPLNLTFQGFA